MTPSSTLAVFCTKPAFVSPRNELYEYRKTLFPPDALVDPLTQGAPILRDTGSALTEHETPQAAETSSGGTSYPQLSADGGYVQDQPQHSDQTEVIRTKAPENHQPATGCKISVSSWQVSSAVAITSTVSDRTIGGLSR